MIGLDELPYLPLIEPVYPSVPSPAGGPIPLVLWWQQLQELWSEFVEDV